MKGNKTELSAFSPIGSLSIFISSSHIWEDTSGQYDAFLCAVTAKQVGRPLAEGDQTLPESPGNHWHQELMQTSLLGKCSVMLFLSEFLPSARGKEQHAALGVKGNALHPAIASLGLRNTSVYQFKRVTLSHHWSPASHMNLILLQPLWHRPRHCRNRCWVVSQGPSYAYWCTLHFSGSSSVWGLCPQYIMFSGIRVWKARPLCEMLPC